MVAPIFLSLVGLEQETDALFEMMGPRLRREFPNENVGCFEGIVDDWSNMKIGTRRKRDFTPLARFFLRWGLFTDKIETIVQPAFEGGVTIGLTRQFGFDVCAGAIALTHSELALKLHWPLVDSVIGARGLPKPVYLFTAPLTDLQERLQKRYFARNTGQQYRPVPSDWSIEEKANYIVRICHEAMVQRDRQFA